MRLSRLQPSVLAETNQVQLTSPVELTSASPVSWTSTGQPELTTPVKLSWPTSQVQPTDQSSRAPTVSLLLKSLLLKSLLLNSIFLTEAQLRLQLLPSSRLSGARALPGS